MAKYEVKMSCGHTVEVQLYGKEADREKKIAWLEKYGMCTECQKADKAEKYAELTAQAAEKAVAENLPELTGTEKQINWALTIRAEKLAEVDSFKVKGLKDVEAQAIKNVLASNTEAKFWIDNRSLDAKSIIKANKMADQIKTELDNLKKAAEEIKVAENKAETNETTDDNNSAEQNEGAEYQITVDKNMTIGEIGLHEDTALGEHYSADTKLADIKQSITYNGDTYIVFENPELITKTAYINGAGQNVYTVPAIKIGSTVDVYKIDGKDFGYLPIYDLCYLVSNNIDWQSPNDAELCTHSIFKVVKDDYNRVCDCTGNATTDDNVDCVRSTFRT